MSIYPFVLSLSKYERLFANVRRFHAPFDKLRANVPRADKAIVNRFLGNTGVHSVRAKPKSNNRYRH